jgi:hypothetical protein
MRAFAEQRRRDVADAVVKASKAIEAAKTRLGDEIFNSLRDCSEATRQQAFRDYAADTEKVFQPQDLEALFLEAKQQFDHEVATGVPGARYVIRNF